MGSACGGLRVVEVGPALWSVVFAIIIHIVVLLFLGVIGTHSTKSASVSSIPQAISQAERTYEIIPFSFLLALGGCGRLGCIDKIEAAEVPTVLVLCGFPHVAVFQFHSVNFANHSDFLEGILLNIHQLQAEIYLTLQIHYSYQLAREHNSWAVNDPKGT